MIKLERQTSLTIDQLKAELENPSMDYPRCLLVNEVAVICLEGNREAEKILRQLLNKEDCGQFAALCCLLILENPDPETIVQLVLFKNNPGNVELVANVTEFVKERELHQIEFRAALGDIKEVVALLKDILGQRITAVLSGRKDASVLDLWISGKEKPSAVEELRLRYGYHAAGVLNTKYDSETARRIFEGSNPVLGDEAPCCWLADHEEEKDFQLALRAALNDEMCS